MLQSPQMVTYPVSDLSKARDWYSSVLDRDPIFDSPLATVFAVGDCTLALLLVTDQTGNGRREVAFWGVDDIDAAYRRLLDAGAAPLSEVTLFMLKSRIAKVIDPFGNVVGIVSSAQQKASVDERPSESAMTVAYCRALATYEDREEIRGPDVLAELFLTEEGKQCNTRILERPVSGFRGSAWG